MNARPEPLLKIEKARKIFRHGFLRHPRAAVDELDLEIFPGHLFGFLGPNGAGKTTTINLILGFLFPDSGSIHLFGLPPTDERSRKDVGFLGETPQADRFETGAGFLRRMDAISGRPKEGREQRVQAALCQVDLAAAGKQAIRTYSKGMAQRIALAKAILGDPEFLILDEPMSNMDPLQREKVKELLVRRKSLQKTTLLSTHNLDDVHNLCDQVLILNKGKKVAFGALKDLIQGPETTRIEFQPPDGWDGGQMISGLDSPCTRVDGDPSRWRIQVNRQDREKVLQHLLNCKAGILSVRSEERSLADLFRQHVNSGEEDS